MKKVELRAAFRRLMRDDLQPGRRLWADDEADGFIQEAREAIARTESRPVKYTFSNPLVIPMLDAKTDYNIPSGLYRITRVSIDGQSLRAETTQSFEYYGIFRYSRLGAPCGWIKDNDTLILDFAPLTAGAKLLKIEGFYLPMRLLADEDTDLAIPEHMQAPMLYWAASRAYLTQDSEAEHIEKSNYFEAQFTKQFGKVVPFDTLRKQGMSDARAVRYGGIR